MTIPQSSGWQNKPIALYCTTIRLKPYDIRIFGNLRNRNQSLYMPDDMYRKVEKSIHAEMDMYRKVAKSIHI